MSEKYGPIQNPFWHLDYSELEHRITRLVAVPPKHAASWAQIEGRVLDRSAPLEIPWDRDAWYQARQSAKAYAFGNMDPDALREWTLYILRSP